MEFSALEFLAMEEGWIEKFCIGRGWERGLRKLLVYVLCDYVRVFLSQAAL